jgi:hypothetical protein
MPLPDEKTISFDLWPNLLMVEGPTRKIGMLIAGLYDDRDIPRDAWTVPSRERSRRVHADVLQQGGDEKMRQGIGVRTDAVVEIIQQRARALALASFRLSGKSKAAM